jgi:hypothetical protein
MTIGVLIVEDEFLLRMDAVDFMGRSSLEASHSHFRVLPRALGSPPRSLTRGHAHPGREGITERARSVGRGGLGSASAHRGAEFGFSADWGSLSAAKFLETRIGWLPSSRRCFKVADAGGEGSESARDPGPAGG